MKVFQQVKKPGGNVPAFWTFLLFLGVAEAFNENFGWITPTNVDENSACYEASRRYIEAFGDPHDPTKNMTWGPIMLDSDGRLPMEGFLSDTIPIPINICDLLNGTVPNCDKLPSSLTNLLFHMPFGFHHNPGSMDLCLEGAHTGLGMKTKYCTIYMVTPDLGSVGMAPPIGRRDHSYANMMDDFGEGIAQIRHMVERSQNREKHTTEIFGFEQFKGHIHEIFKADPSFSPKKILAMFIGLWAILQMNFPNIGMCFPAECSTDDINGNYGVMMKEYNSSLAPLFGTDDNNCFTMEDRTHARDPTKGLDLAILVILASIGVLIGLGTMLEIYELLFKPSSSVATKESSNFLPLELTKSFSLISNTSTLLSTKSGSGRLDSMNGMKFISMTWVVLGHSFLQMFQVASTTGRSALPVYSLFSETTILFEAVLNALPSVDSFFLMGGTLTAYIVFKELDKAGANISRHIITSILYYVHRYLRLTTPYALIMAVIITVLPHLAYGPQWPYFVSAAEGCRKSGWQNLLYVNTLLDNEEPNNCMGVTWYLVCDMVFHFVSLPLIFYPMHFLWKVKGHVASVGYLTIFTFAVTAFVFGLNWTFNMGPTEMFQDVGFGPSTWTYHVSLYYAPWNRYQPYLIGILLGYVLHHTRGKAVNIDQTVNLILWQASFLAAFAVVYGLHDLRSGGQMTLFMASAYNAFQRLAWSFSLAWVIFSCTKGYGGPVNDFLSWSAFAPLSRLTYCCYLIHLEILPMFSFSVLTYPNDLTLLNIVNYFIGCLTISLCAAAIFVLAFETPFTRVEKILVERLLVLIIGSSTEKTVVAQKPAPVAIESKMPPKEFENDQIAKDDFKDEETVKGDVESLEDSGRGSDQSRKSSE